MTFPTFSLFIRLSVTFARLLVARRPRLLLFEKFRFLSKERICVSEDDHTGTFFFPSEPDLHRGRC